MADVQTVSQPLANLGLNLKKEPSSLAQGEYAQLTNMVSAQEGSLSVRPGTQRQSNSGTFGGESIIHTITKMHQGPGEDTRYFGAAGDIWRTNIELPISGGGLTTTRAAFNTSPSGTPYTLRRISGSTFNAGATGTPYEYFACPDKMLKDNGSLTTGDGTGDGTLIQKWGILPPSQPVIATLDKITILPATNDVVIIGGGANDRLTTSISSSTGPVGGGAGYYTCTVASMTGIMIGTLLNVSGVFVIVNETTTTTFSAYFPGTPSGGVTASEVNQVLSTGPTPTLFNFPISLDASFDGMAPNYTTSDPVHVAIGIAEPTKISDIRLRVMVGASFNATGPDYYEKSIAISSVQPVTDLTQTATTNLTTTVPQTVQGVVGPYQPPDAVTQATKAVSLGPASPNQGTGTSVYTETSIPKNTFLAVGQAGSSNFTWKNVVGFQVVAISSVTSSMPTVWVSSIYIAGGFGPEALSINATSVLAPYNYLYCYVNSVTGAISNPCVAMITQNYVQPQRQRVALTLFGTADPQVSGDSSIAVYRAGGAFTDSLYRLIGYAANPGAGKQIIFNDNQSDISIEFADLIEFDNDAPVTSTLSSPARFFFAGFFGGGGVAGQFSEVVLGVINNVPDANIQNFLNAGSVVTFGRGTQKQEDCIVLNVTENVLTVFFQYDHTDLGSQQPVCADCNATANQSCSLSVSAFDSVFVAGDPNNPHVVYKSKNSRPESFAIVELATGISDTANVGSPSNPIVNFCEYGGGLVFLNRKNVYFMQIAFGIMETPIETPATRGLIGRNAWCKVDNEIWYVSYDGVYSWSGGQSLKKSEQLDPLFRGQTIGPYNPIQFGPPNPMVPNLLGSDIMTMAYHDNQVFLVYVDTLGDYYRMRYDTIYQRWSIDYYYDPALVQPPPQLPIPGDAVTAAMTAQYNEEDTGILLTARTITNGPSTAYIYVDEVGTTDGYTGAADSGSVIPYTFGTQSYTLGAPNTNKNFLDWVLEVDNDGMESLTWAAFYDFSDTADVVDSGQFTVPSPAAGRHRIPVSLQHGYGKEAYSVSLLLHGFTAETLAFYSLTLNFVPLTQVQSGRSWDWDELGYRYDKRLYQLIFEYDIPVGQSATVYLDTITGIAGSQQENTAVQTFTLSPPTTAGTGAPTRLTANFALIDVLIVKKIRIRPLAANVDMGRTSLSNPVLFKYFSYSFGDFEQLPPDIVSFTPWSNYGSEYDKYAQQIDLNVDTGGVAGTCSLQADDVTVAGPFPVTTTSENRQHNITLPPQLVGKMFRLVNAAGAGGKFQLYDHKLITLPADKGPVLHSYDFDDLGYQYTKKLVRWTVEYNTSNSPTTILMDILGGIKGETLTTVAFSFVLDGSGRSLQSFNFPDNTFAKMIRFYPQSDNVVFKEWKYRFDKTDYPPDITLFTEYTDFGYACEKIARNLILNIDTGGVPASIAMVADGTTVQTFSVTTTDVDRSRVIATNSELIGRLWKLELTPGANGMTQLFDWKLDFVKEPCTITYYDSYQTDFGYVGYKWIKQAWFWYAAPGGLSVSLFTDNEQLFYEFFLPAQTNRDLARVYFPAMQFNNGLPILNKSKVYRLQISSVLPFKLYSGSRIEWMPIASDQRQAFQSFAIGAEQQLPVASTQAG